MSGATRGGRCATTTRPWPITAEPSISPMTGPRPIATARMIDDDLDKAIADFQLAVAKDPEEPFLRLLLFVAESRDGQRADAQGRLAAYAKAHQDQAWPQPIVDLFLGEGS